MGIYNKYILPRIVDHVCGLKPSSKQREKVVPLASGRVLEVGIGSGLNLPYYNAEKVEHIVGIDPSAEMWKLKKYDSEIPLEFLQSGIEQLDLDNDSVDSIVCTYTLCTVVDPRLALEQMRRVLKPDGKLIFTEHGLANESKIQKKQNRINPMWKRLGGGCNLNRDIAKIIEGSGFVFEEIDSMYIPGWKPACYNTWGVACNA